MARLGVKTRIIDKSGHQVFRGQADGLYARTMEILDTFGDVRVEVERFGYPPSQIVTWVGLWAPLSSLLVRDMFDSRCVS